MIPQRWIEAYLRFLLTYRGVVTVFVALLTAFFAYSLKDLRLHIDFVDFLPRRHPYIEFYNEFQRTTGSPNILSVILEVKRGDIYNPETLQKLDRITKYMIYTKGVVSYQIFSIAHPVLKSVVVSSGTVHFREIFWNGLPHTQADADQIRFSVYADPAIRRLFTASDDTAAVVHTAFWDEALDYGDLYDRMMELKRAEEDDNHTIHITGLPWLYTSVLRYVGETYWVFGCTFLSLSFLLYAYFRRWTGVWMPLFSATLSSIWGLAIAVLFGFNLDPLTLVIPIFLTSRALSHSVQSMDRYHEEFHRTGDKHRAIVASYSRLFAPAIASIVTDGLALLVIAVAPIPLVQKVAVFATFWIVSIFISVITLHPIILSYMNPPHARDPEADPRGRVQMRHATALATVAAAVGIAVGSAGLLPGLWAFLLVAPVLGWYWFTYSDEIYPALTHFVIRCTAGRRRWTVVILTAVLCLVLPMWGWTLKVGDMTPGAALLFADHPYNIAFNTLNEKFLGASQLIVIADTMKPDGIKGDGVLHTVLEFGYHMQSAPGARATISVADPVKEMGRMLRDGDPKWGVIPQTLRERSELLFAFDFATTGDMNRLVDRSGRYASIVTLFNQHSHDIIKDAIAPSRGGGVRVGYPGIWVDGIDGRGRVLFGGHLSDGRVGLFLGDGGRVEPIWTSSGDGPHLEVQAAQVNESGRILAPSYGNGALRSATAALFDVRDGGTHRLLGVGDLTAEGDTVCGIGEFAMNEVGEVAVHAFAGATPDVCVEGIYVLGDALRAGFSAQPISASSA